MKLGEHDPLDLASRMFTLCDMADSEMVRQWAGEVRELLVRNRALKRENGRLAKVIDNVWAALNEAGITVQGARGQMLADALLEEARG